jgi:predicted Zn-dependent protease
VSAASCGEEATWFQFEVLIVPDRAFLEALRAALPPGTRLARSGGWSPNPRVLIPLILAAITLVFVLYRFGVPALADFAARHVPASWERSYGDAVIEALAPADERVQDPRVIGPAAEIHRELLAAGGSGAGDVRLIVLERGVANAFAAPGGHVVVTTGLLKVLDSPDELAAVIAHEHGHIRRGHVMRAIMRRLSLGLLLGLIAGDQSALSGGLKAAGELGELSYSREHEREADEEAIALLERCGAPPTALADALDNITRAAPSAPGLGFLSTHPAPEERRARIRAAGSSAAPAHAPAWRSGAGWEKMKAALVEQARETGRADRSAAWIPRSPDRDSAGTRTP